MCKRYVPKFMLFKLMCLELLLVFSLLILFYENADYKELTQFEARLIIAGICVAGIICMIYMMYIDMLVLFALQFQFVFGFWNL